MKMLQGAFSKLKLKLKNEMEFSNEKVVLLEKSFENS